jgi:tRNA (guanine-N7-)-methyltransferase
LSWPGALAHDAHVAFGSSTVSAARDATQQQFIASQSLAEKTQPVTVIYELESIIEPVPLADLFPTPQPLEVELGAGDGGFLVHYAQRHPERNFIGIERLLGRLRKIERRAGRAGLTNVRAVRIESSYFLEYLLPPGSAAALHIYFPDPWPKRRHWRHRLVNERFPVLARRSLAPGGLVYLRTDDPAYFEQMREVFRADTAFQAVETPAELQAERTDFEAEFLARGVETLRAAFVLGRDNAVGREVIAMRAFVQGEE